MTYIKERSMDTRGGKDERDVGERLQDASARLLNPEHLFYGVLALMGVASVFFAYRWAVSVWGEERSSTKPRTAFMDYGPREGEAPPSKAEPDLSSLEFVPKVRPPLEDAQAVPAPEPEPEPPPAAPAPEPPPAPKPEPKKVVKPQFQPIQSLTGGKSNASSSAFMGSAPAAAPEGEQAKPSADPAPAPAAPSAAKKPASKRREMRPLVRPGMETGEESLGVQKGMGYTP